MREAAISSIARVIFIVDWTERIRRRTTRSLAPMLGAPLPVIAVGPGIVGGGHAVPSDVGLDLVGRSSRTGCFLAPRRGGARHERCLELIDRLPQILLDLFRQIAF